MHVDVNGTRLWFDLDGPVLVPDGARMRRRPTVIVVHGGPGSYDHSYFKPHFGPLVGVAQVIYVDLRDHGRSARHDPADWSLEVCADDLRAFCDALGIDRPVVLGHSLGGFVAILFGARHADRAGALVLLSTMARFDLRRLVEAFRGRAGDEVAELARRDYGGDEVTETEWAKVFAAFGPQVPSEQELARRVRNRAVSRPGHGAHAPAGPHGRPGPSRLPHAGVCGPARPGDPGRRCEGDRRWPATGRWAARGHRQGGPLPVAGSARSPVAGHHLVRDRRYSLTRRRRGVAAPPPGSGRLAAAPLVRRAGPTTRRIGFSRPERAA